MLKNRLCSLPLAGLIALALAGCDGGGSHHESDPAPSPPQASNILFMIMDDVGIDQMAAFGYGGATPPKLPNIGAVANAGLRFHNTWSMPECSPGRASFFVGRYPFRTNIYQAIGPNDLANSQVSPYDVTVPKLLKRAGYENGMFGKFHLAGPENNEAENMTPRVLGWDYFYGWIGGLPGSIDTTAGGIAAESTYSCGFVPGKHAGGTDSGACYQADNSCREITRTALSQDAAGLQCLSSGGIFVPDETCGTPPSNLNFNRENGYYVSPLVIIDGDHLEQVPLSDPRSRQYRTTTEADAAIEWIKSRSGAKPWMATVSFSAAHTPWQQPPGSLVDGPEDFASDGWSCQATATGRQLQNQMTEAMDKEFGRILVETGLASRAPDGSLIYDPNASNTVIVIVGDNGTLGSAVKLPFVGSQAKGTAYQTGVWDPLIVAGPQVVQPGRQVDHMVNAVDLYQFFGEIAGLDVHKEVPRTVDSVALLPYLSNPEQSSLRNINFTMGGVNYQANGGRNAPCVINTTCTQIPTSKGVCEDNQGVYWGPGYTDASVIPNDGEGYKMCADVNRALYNAGRDMVDIMPETSIAVRNDQYKLVRNTTQNFDPTTQGRKTDVVDELYEINQAVPVPLLDTPDRNLLVNNPDANTLAIYDELRATMDRMLASEPACPGDGNRDGVVNAQDLENWRKIAQNWGLSSVYDFFVNGMLDGLTNHVDETIVQNNLNTTCPPSYGVY
ncbi:sulfatase family protein [Bordetella sp. 02P26C-1]|uniref:sulfatase family protein n=1 Tax=Bordetella sp. 02P26C-1 TaxID=2683195 RepID=UPI0013540470|nr:sulfatase-like hydrolase/transferase [Bordetella sp. 02P26C-1]MVW79104.1 sulfatase-like hydrolase/transferase [Bordetella sp. 02P26C-1]